MRLHAELTATGTNTAGFVIPEEVVEELGGGKRPKVSVTADGFTFRTSIARMGGRFLLGMSAERRELSGLGIGDEVELTIELDTEPREVEVPADLQAALEANPPAKAFWESLSYSKQQWHALQVTGAKKAETRAARVARSVAMLSERRAR